MAARSEDPDLPFVERRTGARTRSSFVEVVGRRAALLGREDGVFECWIWPLQVCHGLRFFLRRGDGARTALADHVASVRVDPFELALEHVLPEGRVAVRLFAALEERALVCLFDLGARERVDLEIELAPNFAPMWPAGLGGRVAFRDDASGGLALSEELGRFAALAGSPEAEPLALEADHGLPQGPVAFSIPVSPARAARGPIVFVLAGAEVEPRPLSDAARLGLEGAALGLARAHAAIARARELYRLALVEWPAWRAAHAAHWRAFLERTAELRSGAPAHDRAFLWAKVAIERAWVEVDGLGRGLVAGLAPSRGGGRPGFGWFFDGDALVAARAMTLAGDFELARRVLEFALAHQRADGKLMHELVLSARLVDWLGDYPYAYYKGVNTPDFLGALGAYLDASGDAALATRHADGVERAFRHALGCVDELGRYSTRRAGLTAVEAGPLVGRVESDAFGQALWLEALGAVRRAIAPAVGGPRGERLAADAEREIPRARAALERLVDPASGAWGFAELADGSRCADPSAYHGALVALAPELLGQPALVRARSATAARLDEPALAADWGLRMFSADSVVYDPASYNTGSVFPFLQDFAIRGLFAAGQDGAAHRLLRAQIALDGFSGLGFVPEHLAGDRAVAPERGVPHQIFSSSTIVRATLAGELGFAPRGGVACVFEPTPVPDRARVALARLRVGASVFDATLERVAERGVTAISLELERRSGPPLDVELRPRWPAASDVLVPSARGRVERALRLETRARLGPALFVPAQALERGAASSRPRVLRAALDGSAPRWTVWGLAGRRERLDTLGDRAVAWHGAAPAGAGALEVDFGPGSGWVAREVRAELAE